MLGANLYQYQERLKACALEIGQLVEIFFQDWYKYLLKTGARIKYELVVEIENKKITLPVEFSKDTKTNIKKFDYETKVEKLERDKKYTQKDRQKRIQDMRDKKEREKLQLKKPFKIKIDKEIIEVPKGILYHKK